MSRVPQQGGSAADAAIDVFDLWRRGQVSPCVAPVPSADRNSVEDDPLPLGEEYYFALFRRFLARCRAEERDSLANWFRKEAVLPVGTACSGTDGAVLALHKLSEVVKEDLHCQWHLEHEFGSERVPAKQRFLTTAFPGMKTLYADTLRLGDDAAFDKISQRLVATPRNLGAVIAGFPCVDASALNAKRKSVANRSCLQTGGLQTGSVFFGIFRMLQRRTRRMQFAVFENVPGLLKPPVDEAQASAFKPLDCSRHDQRTWCDQIVAIDRQLATLTCITKADQVLGPSNASVVTCLLEHAGFWVVTWKLSPLAFGIPQSRERLYWLALESSSMMERGFTRGSLELYLRSCMNRLVGSRMHSVAEYIMDDDHPLVRSYLAECAAAGASKNHQWGDGLLSTWGLAPLPSSSGTSGLAGPSQWPKKHRQLFEKQGLDWDASNCEPPWSVKVQFPGLHALTTREFEVLALNGVRSFPDESMKLIETSQTAGRCGAGDASSHAGAVLTRGHRYLSHRCRFMIGPEEMRLQSLFFPDSLLAQFDNPTLCSLAGNAFEVTCCSAVCFCAMLALAAAGASTEPEPGLPASAADTDTDDDDEDVESLLDVLWGRKVASTQSLS